MPTNEIELDDIELLIAHIRDLRQQLERHKRALDHVTWVAECHLRAADRFALAAKVTAILKGDES